MAARTLGPSGKFYREAATAIAVNFPDRDPQFDNDYEDLIRLQQAQMQASAEAHELGRRLERAEGVNLSLEQAASIVSTHYNDQCSSWSAAPRALQLLRSSQAELRSSSEGSPNPDFLDSGPPAAVHLLVEARAHMEMAAPISGPARPGVEMATELLELALMDVAQQRQRLEQVLKAVGAIQSY